MSEADIVLVLGDFKATCQRAPKSGACFFFDPPYFADNKAGVTLYTHESKKLTQPHAQAALAHYASQLKGHVLFTNSDNLAVRKMFAKWSAVKLPLVATTGTVRKELLFIK